MNRILITGGAGFLGAHLSDRLIGPGDVEGMLRMINSPAKFTGPLKLVNPTKVTVIELAEKVITSPRGSSTLSFKPLPQDDSRQRQTDIKLGGPDLDRAPLVCLEDSLKESAAYFRRVLAQDGRRSRLEISVTAAPTLR